MTTAYAFRPDAPVLLIDTSYYIFHRYFATLRWWGFQHPITDADMCMICNNGRFLDAYFKHLSQDLLKFRKKLGTKDSTVLFLRDCPQATIWRHACCEGYKSGRVVSHKLDGRIFQETYAWLNEHHPGTLVAQECLEADDLAYLVKKHLRLVCPEVQLVFLTNDNDYLQLCDDGARCVNAGLKNIQERCKYGGAAATEKRAKILLGDRSDAIGSCMTVEVKKKHPLPTLLAMAEPELIETLQQTSLTAYEHYLRNRALIDMDYIPEEHQTRFAERVRFTPVAKPAPAAKPVETAKPAPAAKPTPVAKPAPEKMI